MGRLTYTGIASLDGYTVDADGDFSWAAPDHEVHTFVNDLIRPVGTYLYGRRMYEVMSFWENGGDDEDDQPASRDFARIWRAAQKVVFSTTLDLVATERTRLEPRFDADAVRRLKEEADADLSLGGPGLATEALRAGLVDELQLFLVPTVVGGGTAYLPDGVRVGLSLREERRFGSGVVYLRYAVASGG